MKKAIFLISFIALAMIADAQKGSWYLGGMIGYNGSTKKIDSTGLKIVTSSWEVSPEIGTFLSKNVQLGLVAGVTGSSGKSGDNKDFNSLSVTPTLYARYFFHLTDAFSLFTGIYLTYYYGTDKYYSYYKSTETEYKGTHSGFGTRLGIGIAYALSPRFTAVAQYGLGGFSSISYKNKDGKKTYTNSAFDVGVNTVGTGSVFNIGLYYTFKK